MVVVEVVEEVVLVELVWHFLDHAVVEQEPINATPVVDTIVLDDALARQDRRRSNNVIAPVQGLRSNSGGRVAHSDQGIKRPKQSCRRVRPAANRHALHNLLRGDIRLVGVGAIPVKHISGRAVLDQAVVAVDEDIGVQRHYAASHADRIAGRGASSGVLQGVHDRTTRSASKHRSCGGVVDLR